MSNAITLTDGRRLAYNIQGPDGAPVILLSNSLMTNYSLWDHFVVQPSLQDFRILRYDPNGHGDSSPPDDPSQTTFVTLSNDVADLLKALGIRKLHTWIGISMGAATSVYFVTRNPGVVQRLIIADTITSSPVNAGVADAFSARADFTRQHSDAIEQITEGTLERWFSESWREANPLEVERMRTLMRTTSRDGYIACCNALSDKAFHLGPLLRDVGTSVETALLLVGERDANLPETMESMRQEISAGFEKQQQISLITIKGAGHIPVSDGLDQFHREISNFLVQTKDLKGLLA